MSWTYIKNDVIVGPFSSGAYSSTASSYVGPLNLYGGAAGAYATRALSSAFIGQPIVRIASYFASTEQDFVALPNGSLDLASIVTYLGGDIGRYVTLYDQSGNGNHLLASNKDGAADFENTTNGLVFTNGSPLYQSTSAMALTQPFATSGVYYEGESSGVRRFVAFDTDGARYGMRMGSYSFIDTDAGEGTRNTNVSANTWYAGQALFNGASSKLLINGTSASLTGSVGSGSVSNKLHPFQDWADTLPSYIRELILWGSDPGDTLRTSIESNQRTFWGF